jgi:hypothetical protein
VPRFGSFACALVLLACEEADDAPAGETGSMVGTTGEPEPWWLGVFHDASLPPGSNASLVFVGNLDVRADGTATGTSSFCDDAPEVAEYGWTMAGDTVTLTGDPLLWEGGEVGAITIVAGTECDEIAIAIAPLDGSSRSATYARGATCLQSNGPSCEVEVVWCDGEPAPCE